MKKSIIIALAVFLIGTVAYAAPGWIYQRTILPESDNAFDLGTSTDAWRNIYLKGNLTNSGLSNGCASWSSGILTSLGVACGSGSGGGSSGGTWSTTTSNVANNLINYPNNSTDIPCIGGQATTTCSFWFNPNTLTFYQNAQGTTTGPFNVFGEVKGTFITATSTTATSTFNGGILGKTVLEFPSTVTQGIRFYNTADQTVNPEYFRISDVGNQLNIQSLAGGSGTQNRNIVISSGGTLLTTATAGVTVSRSSGSAGSSFFIINGTYTQASGSVDSELVNPTITQTGSGQYKILRIAPIETALGSGTSYLIQAGTSTDNNFFTVLNTRNVGVGTSTPGTLFSIASTTNFTTATSTFSSTGGVNLLNGCYAISGACISGSGGGSGTVTSVDMSVPSFLSISGNPITTSGTLAIGLSGTALPVANGGTGQTAFSQGWLNVSDAGAIQSSTSPTVNYITATSTTATSTFMASTTFRGSVMVGTSTTDMIQMLGNQNNPSGQNLFVNGNVFVGGLNKNWGLILGGNNIGYSFRQSTSNAFTGNDLGSAEFTYASGAQRGLYIYNSSGSPFAKLVVQGNIGSGTTSPFASLSIAGNAFFQGTVTATSTASSTFAGGVDAARVCITGTSTCLGAAGGGSGTVTSVDMSVPTGLTISGNPVTTSGTLALALASGFSIPVTNNLISTSSALTAGQVLYATGVNTTAGVATSTLTPSSPLTGSFTQIGSGGALGCQTASGSQAGCLSNTDWTTFNNKQATISGGNGITLNGAQISQISYVATSTNETSGNLAYWTSTSGTPAALGKVATSSETCTGPISCTAHAVLTGGGAISCPTCAIGTLNSGTSNRLTYYSGATTLDSANFFGVFPTTQNASIGTTTPFSNDLLTLATSTGQNLTLTDTSSATLTHWNVSNKGGTFFLSTSSPSTGATTSPPALQINSTGYGSLNIATSTTPSRQTVLHLGLDPATTNGSSTIRMSKLQWEGLDSGGTLRCTYINSSGSLTTQSGACN